MQKIICHEGKCIENDELEMAIEMNCKDEICIEIEKDIIQ